MQEEIPIINWIGKNKVAVKEMSCKQDGHQPFQVATRMHWATMPCYIIQTNHANVASKMVLFAAHARVVQVKAGIPQGKPPPSPVHFQYLLTSGNVLTTLAISSRISGGMRPGS